MTDKDEIELKDILFITKDYINELYKKKFRIIIFSFVVVGISLSLILFQNPNYKAELTFVVEDEKVANPLSSMSGIASQFGFDVFGGGTSTFSQQNIMHLLKSRGVLSKTLLEEIILEDNKNQIIEHYISIYNLREKWSDNVILYNLDFDNPMTLTHDSIVSVIWREIIEDKLNVEIKNDETNIISLSFTSSNEVFSKLFSERLIRQMSRMYISHQTKQATNTIEFLQNRADSVFFELKNSEREYARTKDINQRIIKASGRLKELQLMRNVEVLNTMYLEIIKNLEIAKMTLLNQTPIIQVIDQPILPLKDINISSLLVFLIASFGSIFLSLIYFILAKLFRDSLKN